jgi:hypothetical protein
MEASNSSRLPTNRALEASSKPGRFSAIAGMEV